MYWQTCQKTLKNHQLCHLKTPLKSLRKQKMDHLNVRYNMASLLFVFPDEKLFFFVVRGDFLRVSIYFLGTHPCCWYLTLEFLLLDLQKAVKWPFICCFSQFHCSDLRVLFGLKRRLHGKWSHERLGRFVVVDGFWNLWRSCSK